MADTIKQYVFQKAGRQHIPVSGTFELTPRCNFDCKMCYIHMSPADQEQIGRELTTDQWLDLGQQAVDAGMLYLLLTGGEPFLRPDFCEIYEAMAAKGLFLTINTNGSLMNEKILQTLTAHQPERVHVTLYGSSDETYRRLCGVENSYGKAVRNILRMQEAGIRVDLNTTFTTYNIGDMEQIVEFAKTHQIPVRMANFIFPPVRNGAEQSDINLDPAELGRASAKFDHLTLPPDRLQRRKDYIRSCLSGEPSGDAPVSVAAKCMAGRGAFWISWDGQMYPCGMLSDYAADLRQVSFSEAWTEMARLQKQLMLPAACSVCNYKDLCPVCAAVFQSMQGRTDEVAKELCIRTEHYIHSFLNDSPNQ